MTMTIDVDTKIREIIADLAMLDVGDVSLDNRLDELGVDSMALVEVIFAIEETFDIEVPFNANEPAANEFDISTVRAIAQGVQTLVAQKG